MRKIFLLIGIAWSSLLSAQHWVDSVMNTMTIDQKIGQLIIVRSFSAYDTNHFSKVAAQIERYHIGGVCLFKGTPHAFADAVNLYQSKTKIPLMVSIDGEWGVAMRIDSVYAFPKQQTMGAVKDDSLVYEMGRLVGLQCRRLRIHLNYVPCVDINSNPKNPVINMRSFGEDKENVASKAIAYINGIKDAQILTSAKHFPGHGDTEIDSHLDLPTINHTAQYIDSVDLYPFAKAIQNNVDMVMVSHLNVPALDTAGVPATLSKYIIDTVLRKTLDFRGLVITDGMEMKGIANYYKDGEAEVQALLSGNDLILLPADLDKTMTAIKKAVEAGRLSPEIIDDKCRRVLEVKYYSNMEKQRMVSKDNLLKELNVPEIKLLNKQIFSNAITLVKNKSDLLPLNSVHYKRIASVNVGDTFLTVFQKALSLYANVDHYNFNRNFDIKKIDSIADLLRDYDVIIFTITNTNIRANGNYGITSQTIELIDVLQNMKNKFVLQIFASPYSLGLLHKTNKIDAIVVGYQEMDEAQEIAADLMMGADDYKGRLPVNAAEDYPLNTSITTIKSVLKPIFDNSLQEEHKFDVIDSLAQLGIDSGAYPGCQILLAKDGKVVYEKAFGFHTYGDTAHPVKLDDLYDIASVTKVAGTTLALMHLYDRGKFELDDKISSYLTQFKKTNKANITIRQLLAHQARLKPSLCLYKDSVFNGKPAFSSAMSPDYPIQIADNIYIQKGFEEYLSTKIRNSDLLSDNSYKYSDLGFDILYELINSITGTTLDKYLKHYFYDPLGISRITFHPLEKYPIDEIVPTAYDSSFRKQLVHGYVHDPTVAMLGGVGGPAGLFSNAQSLAVVMQMLLQNGYYAGQQYVKPTTIAEFTKIQYPQLNNRRGAGFDKPLKTPSPAGPSCMSASSDSYGHSGFTGTYVWVDPKSQLIYIFLSNRIYPNEKNNKLLEMNLRTTIHQEAYKILLCE